MSKGKGPKNSKAKWVCVACDKAIEKEDLDSFECSKCLNWCHKKCSNLKHDEFEVLTRGNRQMYWNCKKCSKVKNKKDEEEKSRLETKFDKMFDMLSAFGHRLVEIEKDKKQFSEKLDEKIENAVDKKVREVIEEENERKRRQDNIVVVNIPESSADDPEQRQRDDIEATAALLDKVMGDPVDRKEFKDPVRMGVRKIGKKSKPRLLKITIKNDEFRRKIFRNARKINEGVDDENELVYINPDRTQKERDDYKILKKELEERKKAFPKTEFMIKRGKIVEKTEASRNDSNRYKQKTDEKHNDSNRYKHSKDRKRSFDNKKEEKPRSTDRNQSKKDRDSSSESGSESE